jgi:nucleotide-binding universal stress UspA family protein
VALFPTTVLVAVDGSPASERALDAAWEVCEATGSSLHLVHVKVSRGTITSRPTSPAGREALATEGEELVAAVRQRAEARGVVVTGTYVRGGDSVERALVHAQEELGAGLLVVGASGAGSLGKRLLGTVPTSTVSRASGSVLVVRP